MHPGRYPTTRTAVELAHQAREDARTATRWATLAIASAVINLIVTAALLLWK